MIAFLRGELAAIKGETIVVAVAGIGYKLLVPASAVYNLPQVGEDIFVYTYLHVREDAMQLFGFLAEDERELFEILQNVSGIGPKVALAIISTSTVIGFKQAVLQNKVELLTKIPGIGQKTAQRMILELKDKLAKENMAALNSNQPAVMLEDNISGDALNALTALGYNQSEARRAIAKIMAGSKDEMDVEQLIRQALKELARV